jgi:hypothetical protein
MEKNTRRWNMMFQPELFTKVQALAKRRGVTVSEHQVVPAGLG